jgi:hypothetical protein
MYKNANFLTEEKKPVWQVDSRISNQHISTSKAEVHFTLSEKVKKQKIRHWCFKKNPIKSIYMTLNLESGVQWMSAK